MLDHARLNFLLAFKEIPDYKKAESIVQQRITLLKDLHKRLSEK